MKRVIIGMVILVAVATIFSSCRKHVFCIKGQGSTTSEIRMLNDFDEIDMSISADLYITQDENISSPEIEIEAQGNIIDNIDTYVAGDRLKIKFNDCVTNHKSIKLRLKVRDIQKITLNGSGNIFGETLIKSSSLKVTINGSGDMDMGVEADELKAAINGSGNIMMAGAANYLEAEIIGSGDIKAFDLYSQNADVFISGSGETRIRAEQTLEVRISGSGDVHYKGYPQMTVNISGSGKVINAN